MVIAPVTYDEVIAGICNLLENWDEVDDNNNVMSELTNFIYVKRREYNTESPKAYQGWG